MADSLDQVGMVFGILQCVERHDEVHHRWIDRAQTFGMASTIENPMLGLADGGGADAVGAALLPHFENTVQMVKKDREALSFGKREADIRQEQLIERETGRCAAIRSASLHDRERHQDGTRPRRHLVEHIARQHGDFRGHRRHMLARIKAEEAEIDFDVAVGRLQSAKCANALACAAKWLGVRVHAGQLQSAVGFDCRADVRGSADERAEAAVGQLPLKDGAYSAIDPGPGGRVPNSAIGLVKPKLEQDVIGFKCAIGGQFAAPETAPAPVGRSAPAPIDRLPMRRPRARCSGNLRRLSPQF